MSMRQCQRILSGVCVQAVMVAWAQATIPPRQASDLAANTQPLGRPEPASDVVSRTLAAISDPFVQLHSQTKHI